MNTIVKRLMENHMIDNKQTPDQMYKDYLSKHVEGVKKVYEEILKPILLDQGISGSIITQIDRLVSDHDKSKYAYEEWNSYRDYFYDKDRHENIDQLFDIAWNHHQKCNPHHWQYWILLKDSGDRIVLDMPFEYVIEMLCDWHSFIYRDPTSTAYKWYHDNKDKMVLSDHTHRVIQCYIDYLK